MISISRPFIGPEEEQAVLEVLRSGQLSQGAKVAEFEEAFAKYHGAKYAVAVNNGTTALVAALMAHYIGPGDEVIVPSFSFFATASCVLSVGAKPVFADIDPDTFCLSPKSVEKLITDRTIAVIPVHLYGNPADLPRLEDLCQKHKLALIGDAAQAHGAQIAGRSVGAWGTAAFSFYPTKNMTTLEGGMVLTNEKGIETQLRMIRNQGMSEQYMHEVVGYNFRMTDLSAAIGLAQLNRLPEWTTRRIRNAQYMSSRLRGFAVPKVRPETVHVFHQYTIRVPAGRRKTFVEQMQQEGIGVRIYYERPIHQQPVFARCVLRDPLLKTKEAASEVVSLPIHPHLNEEELERIVSVANRIGSQLFGD